MSLFLDGLSQSDFETIIYNTARKIKRIMSISINGPVISGRVQSQSGISVWSFTIDFNDYGHTTGRYWVTSSNSDSTIPTTLAERISCAIKERVVNSGNHQRN